MKIVFCDLLGLTYDGSTLKKRGLGGSESAVILLSKELVKLGFSVTVFNNCIDKEASPGIYDGVQYIDHSQIDQYKDTPDLFISSRSVLPFHSGHSHSEIAFSASKRILWMHDTFAEGEADLEAMLVGGYIDEVFTLSDFHTNYVLNCNHGSKRNFEVLKHKVWQTRNGAVKHIEEIDLSKKDPFHFVYNASVTKGLIPLLTSIWPKLKENLPGARLTVIGGYYRFREGAEPDEQEKTLQSFMMQEHQDVTFTGVITQHEIAKILSNATFMLYPTAFPETFGISSLESLLYKTPIITSRFGALEETAIDLACYKINYSATKNVLFQNIDEEEQTQRYVDTVLNAVNNPYLLQQKQNYCGVLSDVHGWNTVALQWKQHIYELLDENLSVEEYRKVSIINEKVSRVFGRRFNNSSERKQYRSYGTQRRIVIISPFWNAETYIQKHIESVSSQDYDHYLHILVDDASTDLSYEKAKESIDKLPSYLQSKFILKKNNENKGCIYNQLSAIEDYVHNEDIVMFLDGDDWLVPNNTIFQYYNNLYQEGYEFTYGSMWSLADRLPLVSQDYPQKVKENRSYRDHFFNWKIPYTHLRTVLGSYTKKLRHHRFQVNGNWMKAGADNPLFYDLIEQIDPKKIFCNKEIVCVYNDLNPLNDYKIRSAEQNINAETSYNEKNLEKKMKKILVGIPTNKYVETETMKSLWDLEIPEGYALDLQFFHGYNIDQIRNLIAEWAKNYDYLFSVDSDIVLPKDTLSKFLSANKDVVSGLYIQRIPNTHTVELYMDTPNGGCTNIPYNLLKNKGLVEVAACGMGVALIKSEVFRKLEYPHFFYKSALNHQDTVSEDVFFCMKARTNGFSVWADTSVLCDHKGSTFFKVEPDKTHLEKIAEQDLLPREHSEYLKNMNIQPSVIYDIGSCVQHWTRKAKEVWPDSTYILFDGAKSVEPFLEKSGDLYALCVLSDQDGSIVDFYEDTNNPGGNSYYKETTGFFTEQHKTKRITFKLDTLVERNHWPKPDLIKLDVQGAELDILKGAKSTIEHCSDVIIECQHSSYNEGAPLFHEVKSYLESIGFSLISVICKNDIDGDYHFKKI